MFCGADLEGQWQNGLCVLAGISKSAPQNTFLELASHYPISGVLKNCSESSGSFHDHTNNLRPAVEVCTRDGQVHIFREP